MHLLLRRWPPPALLPSCLVALVSNATTPPTEEIEYPTSTANFFFRRPTRIRALWRMRAALSSETTSRRLKLKAKVPDFYFNKNAKKRLNGSKFFEPWQPQWQTVFEALETRTAPAVPAILIPSIASVWNHGST